MAPKDLASMKRTTSSAAPTSFAFDWTTAYEEHHQVVLHVLQAEGLSAEEAREFAQAAWVRLFERFQAGPRQPSSVAGLVIVTARNLFIDAYRRRSKWPEVQFHPDLGVGPEDLALTYERRALLRLIEHVLGGMAARDAAVFISVAVEERSIEAVAAEHRLGRSQTYAIVARVRASLKRWMTSHRRRDL